MKKLLLSLIILFVSGNALGENTINIPYEEFKLLYQESIKKQLLENVDDTPFIYSIDTAFYKMKLSPGGASCTATLAGRLISGDPEPFKIFSDKTIIEDIIEVSGGSLISKQGTETGIEFFPQTEKAFSIKAKLFIPASEDQRSRFITMAVPQALKNAISYTRSKNSDLIEPPGIKNKSGVYNFSSRSSLTIRYSSTRTGRNTSKDRSKTKALSSRFQAVDSPPIVLDSVTCFTSFEESGSSLSVLIMTVPSEAGDYFKLKSLPNTSIWSLKVNGVKRAVYHSDSKGKDWILPLAKGKASHIELALLGKGKKIGLRGRLEVTLPGMEFPARKANIAIGLPPRVQLVSFEGTVAPDSTFSIKAPEEFIGKPYYFSKSFYKGEGINIVASYKEPVKH